MQLTAKRGTQRLWFGSAGDLMHPPRRPPPNVRSPCLTPTPVQRGPHKTLGLDFPGVHSGFHPKLVGPPPGRPHGLTRRAPGPGREIRVLLPRLGGAACSPHLRLPCSPPHFPHRYPPRVHSLGAHSLSMIAQPVARILICIPRRPARPGHQPTFGPETPAARPAPAPGRMLKVVI